MSPLERSAFHVAMRIPTPIVKLNEADAAFAKPPREQTIIRKAVFARFGAVARMNLGGFAGNVGRLGHAHLHTESQFVLTDPREGFGVAELFSGLLVDGVDRVNRRAALVARDALRIAREENGLTVSLTLDP